MSVTSNAKESEFKPHEVSKEQPRIQADSLEGLCFRSMKSDVEERPMIYNYELKVK